MKPWLKLALAEDRALLALIDYMLILHPRGLQYGHANAPDTLFTTEDADRLSNLMDEWEAKAKEMSADGFDPKKMPEYEALLKEIRSKMLPAWRAVDVYGSVTLHSVVKRVGIRR